MMKSTKTTAVPHARARARIASRALEVTPTKARRRKPADVVDAVHPPIEPATADLTPPPAQPPVEAPPPPASTVSAAAAVSSRATKSDLVLKQLAKKGGISIASIMEATGWQAHSVRGFLSAVVRKKHGLNLLSDIGKDGERRYRVETTTSA